MVILFLLFVLCVVKVLEVKPRPVAATSEGIRPWTPRINLEPVPHTHKGPVSQPPFKKDPQEKVDVKIPKDWYDEFLEWQQNNRRLFGSQEGA